MQTKAMTELPIRLGRSASGEPVILDMVAASHALICGEVRSGKSVLTYLLLGGLAPHFETVRVVGIDPTSVLLGPFRDRFPDRLIALGTTDVDHIMAVLDALIEEMDRRLLLLRELGTDKLAAFDRTRPLYVIVLEELPGIVRALEAHDKTSGAKPAERLAPRARLAIERLVSEAAKCGFRVVSLAQRPDADVLGGYARAQMPTRIALRMGSAEDVRMVLSDVNSEDAAAAVNAPPGVGFIRTPGPHGLRRFRVDHVPDYDSYVRRVRQSSPTLVGYFTWGDDDE